MSAQDFINKLRQTPTQNKFKLAEIVDNKEEPLTKDFDICIFGRNSTCNIRIDKEHVSRFHAVIYFAENQLCMRDLDSRQGTFIVEKKTQERLAPFVEQKLSVNDVIQIGDVHYKIAEITFPTVETKATEFQQQNCQFCGEAVQIFRNECNAAIDTAAELKESHQRTDAVLAKEEERLKQLIEKLKGIRDSEQEFAKSHHVMIQSAAEILGTQTEQPKTGLKSAKKHVPTPYSKNVTYDDSE